MNHDAIHCTDYRQKCPEQTVVQMLTDIVTEVCDHYCKYAAEWSEEKDEEMAARCWECPLNRMGV